MGGKKEYGEGNGRMGVRKWGGEMGVGRWDGKGRGNGGGEGKWK